MSNTAGMTATAVEQAMIDQQEKALRDLTINEMEQKIMSAAAMHTGGLATAQGAFFVDKTNMLGQRKQYGHHSNTVARAKGKLELYTLEERKGLVWDVKPVTIALGVGQFDNIVLPGDLYDSRDAALAEARRRTRTTVRGQAKAWTEALTVSQLEGGALDDAELDLLAQINRYIEATQ